MIRQKLQHCRAYIVYQAGIANVFSVESWGACASLRKRTSCLMQSDFRTCEAFARGLAAAGCDVRGAECNQAGDISDRVWGDALEDAPFSESMNPPGGRTKDGCFRIPR